MGLQPHSISCTDQLPIAWPVSCTHALTMTRRRPLSVLMPWPCTHPQEPGNYKALQEVTQTIRDISAAIKKLVDPAKPGLGYLAVEAVANTVTQTATNATDALNLHAALCFATSTLPTVAEQDRAQWLLRTLLTLAGANTPMWDKAQAATDPDKRPRIYPVLDAIHVRTPCTRHLHLSIGMPATNVLRWVLGVLLLQRAAPTCAGLALLHERESTLSCCLMCFRKDPATSVLCVCHSFFFCSPNTCHLLHWRASSCAHSSRVRRRSTRLGSRVTLSRRWTTSSRRSRRPTPRCAQAVPRVTDLWA